MKSLICIILFLATSIQIFGQESSKVSKAELRYDPKNLEECYIQLDKMLEDSVKTKIINWTEEEFSGNAHFGLGMWIRNNWGLWRGGELSKYFNELKIYHPDDMSGIILTSYHRKLHNKDVDLQGQIKYYQDFWEKQNQAFQNAIDKYEIGNQVFHKFNRLNLLLKTTSSPTVFAEIIEKKDRQIKIRIIKYDDNGSYISWNGKKLKPNKELWDDCFFWQLVDDPDSNKIKIE